MNLSREEKSTNIYSLEQLSFVVIAFLFLGAFGVLISFILGVPITLTLGAVSLLLALYLLKFHPVFLLFSLLIVRMSLDFFGDKVETLNLSLSQLLGIEILLIAIAFFFLQRNVLKKVHLWWVFVPIIVWGVATIPISVAGSPFFVASYEIARILNITFIFLLSFVVITDRERLGQLLRVLMYSSIIPIVFGIVQFFYGIGFTDNAFELPRIFGTFAHPNIFSTYLVAMVAIALLYGLVYAKTKTGKNMSMLMLGVYIAMMMLTFTRVAWLSLLVFFLLIALLRYRWLIVAVVLIPILTYLAFPAVQDRVQEAFRAAPDSSIVWRINLWHDTTVHTLNSGRSWYGNGMNAFSDVAENIRGNRFGSTQPHNEFVRAFVEAGYIGLGLFLFYTITVAVYVFMRYLKAQNLQERLTFLVLFSLFVTLAIASFSDHIFRSTPLQFVFWSLLGASIATFYTKKISE